MTALAEHLKALIHSHGPLPLDRYMLECLAHPSLGYYMTAEPFGVKGDFTTAPEVSQMFGELLGLWLAEQWIRMGQPAHTRLVEIGPGRGTLMADALRALSSIPGMRDTVSVHLVETSPRLERVQKATLSGQTNIHWHNHINDVPEGPLLLIANELFDALPIRQFVKSPNGWAERHVGLTKDDQFQWQDIACPNPQFTVDAKTGDIVEAAPMAASLMSDIAHRMTACEGAGLIIDYGYTAHAVGDSLQALKDHAYTNPLEHQGTSDLTTHVNFAALKSVALKEGLHVLGPVSQGAFLCDLGIEARADQLSKKSPDKANMLDTAKNRLIHNDQMGQLFKVMGVMSAPRPASGFGEGS